MYHISMWIFHTSYRWDKIVHYTVLLQEELNFEENEIHSTQYTQSALHVCKKSSQKYLPKTRLFLDRSTKNTNLVNKFIILQLLIFIFSKLWQLLLTKKVGLRKVLRHRKLKRYRSSGLKVQAAFKKCTI